MSGQRSSPGHQERVVWLTDRDPNRDRAPKPQRRSPWRVLRRVLGWMLLMLAAIMVMGAAGAWLLGLQDAIAHLPALLDRIKPYLVALHFLLIAGLWWRWNVLVHWLYRRGRVHPDNVKLALAMRNRVVAFFLAFEFLVVLRWPFPLLERAA